MIERVNILGPLSVRGVPKRACFMLSALLLLSAPVRAECRQSRFEATTLAAGNALKLLSPGLNVGNTLEAIPNETSWGNPPPNVTFFEAVRAAGFKSVRIPVAWAQHADAKDNIESEWISHVGDVVKMAIGQGLYVVVNIHSGGDWLQPTYAQQSSANLRLKRLWLQIANYFKDFDDHLLFAGTNEVHVKDVYSPATQENAEVQNGFNQLFVSVVRSTRGRNLNRFLVVQGYNTNIDDTVRINATLPKDPTPGRIMMEVHYYTPYDFTLNDKSSIWQWGTHATVPAATTSGTNEAYVDAQFQDVKSHFVEKGVPVILGEYAAGLKMKFPGMNRYRKDWDEYVTRSAYAHGIVPMVWDIGIDTGLFNRRTGVQQDPEVIKLIVTAAR